MFSLFENITEGFAVCVFDRVKKGLPVWSTSRPKTSSPRRSWWRRMIAFRWAGQSLPSTFSLHVQRAVSRLPLKWLFVLQHECAPLLLLDESMPSLIAKIWLSHSSGGFMPVAKWRMKTQSIFFPHLNARSSKADKPARSKIDKCWHLTDSSLLQPFADRAAKEKATFISYLFPNPLGPFYVFLLFTAESSMMRICQHTDGQICWQQNQETMYPHCQMQDSVQQ